MSPETLQKIESALRARRAELAARLEQRDGILIESAADVMDALQNAQLRDLAVTEITRNSTPLGQIETALSRIESGEYGVCLSCDGEIGAKRLAAVPWAARCVRCQDRADREGSAHHGFPAAPQFEMLYAA